MSQSFSEKPPQNKILIISGPTATGKTALAVSLAKKINGELISADSRQIYRGMNIGTGKDHPVGIKVHLIDLIDPNQSFSVVQYQQLTFQKIQEIHLRHKLPVIVGGTGQYIDSLINPHKPTYSLKPNKILRFFLDKLSVVHLQKLYQLLAGSQFNALNNSERYNRHRLIRKIEITLSSKKNQLPSLPARPVGGSREGLGVGFNILHLSLTAPNSYLYHRIDARVQERLDAGLINEIKSILEVYHWSDPGLNCLAYKEFKPYFQNNFSPKACIQKWRFDEHAYVRRQKTWFKKQGNLIFLDISRPCFPTEVFKLVDKWYNQL